MTESSCLYTGHVFHKRRRPALHTLRYRVFSMMLALDEIDAISQRTWLFSRNRFNLFAVHDADFGERAEESLGDFVTRKLREAGIETPAKRILLSCYPRVLGYAFNPLSLFYCLDLRGNCFAVIHEVHNTFGERHWYVLPVDGNDKRETGWIHQSTDKQLFVSPFAHMDMRYRFRLNEPGERQVIVIHVDDEQGLLITASYIAQRRALTNRRLMGYLLAYPAMGVKIIVGIHWEALRLWRKRVPWFRHQPLETGRSHGHAE